MRRPNFKGWITRELLYLSGENTLNLRRLAFLAQNDAPRLWERLVLYAVSSGRAARLTGFLYREEMIAELDMINRQIGAINLDNPDIFEKLQLPLRYDKVLRSYKAAYQKIETRNASKKLRWEKTIELQKKKGISNAQICQALGLDTGNTNAYLKYAEIDRVSLEKATEIMKYLFSAHT